MILSDADIKAALRDGSITVTPPPEADQFCSTALDLRLGPEFRVWSKDLLKTPGLFATIDPSHPEFRFGEIAARLTKDAETERDGSFVLVPGELVLGLTFERIELPRDRQIAARVEGRSTLARLGLGVHITAPTIHAGFRGRITLEIVNHGCVPLKLMPEQLRVCQLIFERVSSPPLTDLDSEFQDQRSVLGKCAAPESP